MGDLIITATFEGGFDEFESALDAAQNPEQWTIIKRAECCPACRANKEPLLVPPFTDGLHPNCHCLAVRSE